MVSKVTHHVRPGGLSKQDHEYIEELAGRGWKATRIARCIEKHPCTVQWYMYRSGLAAPKYRDQEPYMRGGRLVVPFTPEEDAFIEALRVQGYGLKKIADVASKRYGAQRSPHVINCRLIMLAAREVA
jgi:hypothetical protein